MYGPAMSLAGEKLYDASPALSREVLEAERRVLGADHPRTLDTWTTLGETLHQLHRDAEARKIAAEALDSLRRQNGPLSTAIIGAERALADDDDALGQRAAAAALRRQADRDEQQLHLQWEQAMAAGLSADEAMRK